MSVGGNGPDMPVTPFVTISLCKTGEYGIQFQDSADGPRTVTDFMAVQGAMHQAQVMIDSVINEILLTMLDRRQQREEMLERLTPTGKVN